LLILSAVPTKINGTCQQNINDTETDMLLLYWGLITKTSYDNVRI